MWLGDGVVEDETDGHVDNLACFAAPGVVALTWTDDRDDPQHAVSADARAARAAPRRAGGSRCTSSTSPARCALTEDEAARRRPGRRDASRAGRATASPAPT